MAQFKHWFDQNSGYSPHGISLKDLYEKCPCGAVPIAVESLVYLPLPGDEKPFPLFCCPNCKSHLAKLENGYYKLDSLLKYRIEHGK